MATKQAALSLLKAWAKGEECPKANQLQTERYALSNEQARALWNLAHKPSGSTLNTDSPIPR